MDRTKNTINVFNKYAQAYNEKYMDVSLYKPSLKIFCKTLKKKNPEILELACGPGNLTKYILEQRPDFKITATDLSPNMLEIAKSNNPSIQVEKLDCRELNSLNRTFDAIVCGFGLPYLSKEEVVHLIEGVRLGLHQNGLCYLSIMEADFSKSGIKKSSNGEDELYIYYHQGEFIEKALRDNKLKAIHTARLTNPLEQEITSKDLVIIAQKTD